MNALTKSQSRLRWLVFTLLLGGCVGSDQVSKHMAVDSLQGEPPFTLLGEIVRIEYAENTGAFLGLGENMSDAARFWILLIGTGALLVGVIWYLYRNLDMPWTTFISMSLIVAGGIGNLVDRAVAGYVVDFVSVGLGPVRTGVFNIADVAITGGAIWLAFESFFLQGKVDEEPTEAAT
ncbi:MAG: signal peptidase II [Planctomycetota bacterium]|jgi:signal peptidase II